VAEIEIYGQQTKWWKCPGASTSPEGSTQQSDCVCDAGHHSLWCVGCDTGKYKSTTGSAECTVCPIGKYSDSSVTSIRYGATACADCPTGWTTEDTGASSTSKCSVVYVACSAGSYKSGSECTACPDNSNSPYESTALSDCACNIGYDPIYGAPPTTRLLTITLDGGSYPEEVSVKIFDSQGTEIFSLSAEQSQPATVVVNEGTTYTMTAYDSFGDGWVGAAHESVTATYTIGGTTTTAVSIDKAEFAYGAYQGPSKTFTIPDPRVFQSCTVTPCEAGKYKITGSTACVDCEVGKYSASVGATQSSTCLSCPTNADSSLGSSVSTACTCNSGSTGPDGGPCGALQMCGRIGVLRTRFAGRRSWRILVLARLACCTTLKHTRVRNCERLTWTYQGSIVIFCFIN